MLVSLWPVSLVSLWSRWQAIQTITDYKPPPQACDDDTSLPDALNHFYSRFELQNDTPAQKLLTLPNDQALCLSPADVRKTLSRINSRKEEFCICHIHNYTEYNQQWNVFSAFNPSKFTHTWSSGQPTMRRSGSSWCLAQGSQLRVSPQSWRIPAGAEIWTHNLGLQVQCSIH